MGTEPPNDPRKVVKLEALPFPEPCYSVAISPKTKGQEDKVPDRAEPQTTGNRDKSLIPVRRP